MELQTITNEINQIWQLFSTTSPSKRCLETPPMKRPFRDAPISSPFPRATPESTGVPSRVLEDFYRAINDDRSLDMHAVTVLKDGAVVAEADFGAYDRGVWHISYSACKSVVSLAVGMLVDEGRLDIEDKVIKLLPDRVPKLALLTMKDLTVKHLLTMTSGAGFNEAGSVTEEDWVHSYLESSVHFEHGSKFNYNSMNTYLLSAIVCRVTGESLTEYLRPRLWEPLDITELWWETCPMGIEKGGWGLYMRQEDFAKIGQLVLNRGEWNGKRLISREWIRAATSVQAHPSEKLGDYDYGYQIWVGRQYNSFLFSGMFGQNVLGFFDTGVLMVSNAGNDELFQTSNFFLYIHEYLAREFAAPLPENASAQKSLTDYLASLRFEATVRTKRGFFPSKGAALPPECKALDGRVYFPTTPNAPSQGLLPLMMQGVQNSYTQGLMSLSFSIKGEAFRLTVHEMDVTYILPVGFQKPEYTELDFHGERHRVAVTGRFAKNEDGLDVLVMRVSFLESASARRLKFFFEPDWKSFNVQWWESPGAPFIKEGVEGVLDDLKPHPVLAGLIERSGRELAFYKIKAAFQPEMTCEERGR